MSILSNIKNRVLGSGGLSKEDSFIMTLHKVMATYGYTIDEVMDMYIPTYQTLVWAINREAKDEQKALEKNKGRKR